MEPIQITYEDIIEKCKARIADLEYQLMFKEAESDAKDKRIDELVKRVQDLESNIAAIGRANEKGAKK